jgi:hypothetical protein
MGFGGLNKVSLADARKKASDARLLLSEGRNPLVQKRENATERATAEKQRSMTFDQCAEAYISAHEIAWKNDKHRQHWRNTLATYVSPVFGKLPVGDVDTDRVLKVRPKLNRRGHAISPSFSRIKKAVHWSGNRRRLLSIVTYP